MDPRFHGDDGGGVIPIPSFCHSRESENPSLLSILDPRFRGGDGEETRG